MGSRDSVQKGLDDDSKATNLETVIVVSPENIPNWGSSTLTYHGTVEDLNHSGKEIASSDSPMEHQIGFQLGKQGEGVVGASDLRLASATKRDLRFINGDSVKTSCVINVNCADGEDSDSVAKICRICHLDSDIQEPDVGPKIRMDFIELGCSCKGELGYAHSSCAATWFNRKGNRLCEICGKTAENVIGIVVDHRFMQQWNENRLNSEEANSPERGARCWQGQPCCNLLLACLVMSFIIPWLLRMDMF